MCTTKGQPPMLALTMLHGSILAMWIVRLQHWLTSCGVDTVRCRHITGGSIWPTHISNTRISTNPG